MPRWPDPPDNLNPLIKTLRNFRLAAGIPTTQLGIKTGLGVNSIRNWERGHNFPVLPNFIAWANALGYDVTLTPRSQ